MLSLYQEIIKYMCNKIPNYASSYYEYTGLTGFLCISKKPLLDIKSCTVNWVAYIRVSTQNQQRDGSRLQIEKFDVVIVEVCSGKENDRPGIR